MSKLSRKCKVRCMFRCGANDGEQLVNGSDIIIDDEEDVYRFTCPECGMVSERRMGDEIRELLRSDKVGAPTIEELVQSFAATLEDDKNVVRALLR